MFSALLSVINCSNSTFLNLNNAYAFVDICNGYVYDNGFDISILQINLLIY